MSTVTVVEIIGKAGGAPTLAETSTAMAAADTTGLIREVKAKAVYKWSQIGIPEKHWPLVMKVTGVTERQLHQANCELQLAVRRARRQRRGDLSEDPSARAA